MTRTYRPKSLKARAQRVRREGERLIVQTLAMDTETMQKLNEEIRRPIAAEMERLRAAQAPEQKTKGSIDAGVSDCYPWTGELRDLPSLVWQMMSAGMHDCQVKLSVKAQMLRLSDYHTRAVALPGEFFWIQDGEVKAGSREDWQAARDSGRA